MIPILVESTGPIGPPILGYIIPAFIFLISFMVAWGCYKHFTKKLK